MDKKKLKKYAEVLVRVGINLKEKDDVVIYSNTDALPLLREVVRACWRAGAKDVITRLTDNDFTLAKYEEGNDYVFDYYPEFEVVYSESMMKKNYHSISIGAPTLELLKNVNLDYQRRVQAATMKAQERLNKYMDSGKVKWVGASYPTIAWAKTVFPDLPEEEAIEALWDKIFEAARVNEEDPVKAWEAS